MFANERQKVNAVNLLVTLCVLFFAVEMSSGNFATRINKISENLDRALSEVMDGSAPIFTELSDNATYISDTTFNARGMAGLYNLTTDFMELIFSKEIYPEGFLSIDANNKLQIGDYQKEWQSLLGKYAGILTMVIILGLLFIFMPLCGLFFCCCRCCGRCGARSQPFDKKHDLCKKIVLAMVLIGLGTLLLFGVVCVFVSNQQTNEGIDELTTNLRKGLTDVSTYLDTTKNQIDTLLRTNYNEFERILLNITDKGSSMVYKELENYSNATSMTELSNVVKSLPDIETGFITLKYSTLSLRVYASQLSDAVRKVKKDMLDLLKTPVCANYPKCQEINRNISLMQTNIHFNNYIDRYFPKLPDISDKINTLNTLVVDSDLTNAVKNGQDKLEQIETEIAAKVNETLAEARTKIAETREQITAGADNVTSVIADMQREIVSNSRPAVKTAEKYIKDYEPYRYYVALAISCVLLVISLFVALGLICGICGKRPEGYGDDCCNKGAGSRFLICGVMFMFIMGFVVSLVVLVTFLVGTVAQRVVCDPLRDPQNSQIFKLLDQVNFSQINVDTNLSQVLISCYQNKSIYEVFHLEKQLDLDKFKEYEDKLNSIISSLNLGSLDVLQNFTILSDSEMALLKSFAGSNFSDFSFDEFKALMATSFVTVNLTDLSTDLGDLIDEIPLENEDLIGGLKLNKMHIDMYQDKIVNPMIENATEVTKLAEILEVNLTLGHASFNEAMDALLAELTSAQMILRENGTKFLNNTIVLFSKGIVEQVQTYINHVVNNTKEEVGKCGPLSLVLNATLTSTCDKILLPWNGYWFGLFWSLLVFIPTIIVSVKLATLYQKHSAYSRDLIEAEYLYDAYVDRDNIPLNSRSSKSKKKNKKHKRYEDRPAPSAGGDMVAREYAAGSNQDARYADMAPKQWEDFPAGGPPQYQRAPTEYERPPPYYYPGAASENAQ